TTYDHTHWKIRDPVRSPIDKPVRAGLVVESVTISEYLVLYVLLLFFSIFLIATHQADCYKHIEPCTMTHTTVPTGEFGMPSALPRISQ
ncbi:hypothetical protein LZ30DRAFT_186151, partial [Colletotrichum cereale]